MVEVIEQPTGYVVRSNCFQDTFQCKANAFLAARILATGEAVMQDRDVSVLLTMGNGEIVRMEVLAQA